MISTEEALVQEVVVAATQPLPVASVLPGAARRPGRARPVSERGSAPGPGPLRLTRRGRAVVRLLVGLAFALVIAAAVLLLGRPALAGTESRPVPVRYHVVLPGETLLEIAAEVDPSADPRDTAVRIARLNALTGWGLQAGQQLALPVGQ